MKAQRPVEKKKKLGFALFPLLYFICHKLSAAWALEAGSTHWFCRDGTVVWQLCPKKLIKSELLINREAVEVFGSLKVSKARMDVT